MAHRLSCDLLGLLLPLLLELFHVLAQTQRSHVRPHFVDVRAAFLARAFLLDLPALRERRCASATASTALRSSSARRYWVFGSSSSSNAIRAPSMRRVRHIFCSPRISEMTPSLQRGQIDIGVNAHGYVVESQLA